MAHSKILKPWFVKVTNYLWDHRRKLPECFEDPDYGGTPAETYKPLSGAFILVIKDLWDSGSSDRFHQYKDRDSASRQRVPQERTRRFRGDLRSHHCL